MRSLEPLDYMNIVKTYFMFLHAVSVNSSRSEVDTLEAEKSNNRDTNYLWKQHHDVICKDATGSHNAIVCNVHRAHDEIVAANPRPTAAVLSAAVNGDVFTNLIAITDFAPALFAGELLVLRRTADIGKRKDGVLAANPRV